MSRASLEQNPNDEPLDAENGVLSGAKSKTPGGTEKLSPSPNGEQKPSTPSEELNGLPETDENMTKDSDAEPGRLSVTNTGNHEGSSSPPTEKKTSLTPVEMATLSERGRNSTVSRVSQSESIPPIHQIPHDSQLNERSSRTPHGKVASPTETPAEITKSPVNKESTTKSPEQSSTEVRQKSKTPVELNTVSSTSVEENVNTEEPMEVVKSRTPIQTTSSSKTPTENDVMPNTPRPKSKAPSVTKSNPGTPTKPLTPELPDDSKITAAPTEIPAEMSKTPLNNEQSPKPPDLSSTEERQQSKTPAEINRVPSTSTQDNVKPEEPDEIAKSKTPTRRTPKSKTPTEDNIMPNTPAVTRPKSKTPSVTNSNPGTPTKPLTPELPGDSKNTATPTEIPTEMSKTPLNNEQSPKPPDLSSTAELQQSKTPAEINIVPSTSPQDNVNTEAPGEIAKSKTPTRATPKSRTPIENNILPKTPEITRPKSKTPSVTKSNPGNPTKILTPELPDDSKNTAAPTETPAEISKTPLNNEQTPKPPEQLSTEERQRSKTPTDLTRAPSTSDKDNIKDEEAVEVDKSKTPTRATPKSIKTPTEDNVIPNTAEIITQPNTKTVSETKSKPGTPTKTPMTEIPEESKTSAAPSRNGEQNESRSRSQSKALGNEVGETDLIHVANPDNKTPSESIVNESNVSGIHDSSDDSKRVADKKSKTPETSKTPQEMDKKSNSPTARVSKTPGESHTRQSSANIFSDVDVEMEELKDLRMSATPQEIKASTPNDELSKQKSRTSKNRKTPVKPVHVSAMSNMSNKKVAHEDITDEGKTSGSKSGHHSEANQISGTPTEPSQTQHEEKKENEDENQGKNSRIKSRQTSDEINHTQSQASIRQDEDGSEDKIDDKGGASKTKSRKTSRASVQNDDKQDDGTEEIRKDSTSKQSSKLSKHHDDAKVERDEANSKRKDSDDINNRESTTKSRRKSTSRTDQNQEKDIEVGNILNSSETNSRSNTSTGQKQLNDKTSDHDDNGTKDLKRKSSRASISTGSQDDAKEMDKKESGKASSAKNSRKQSDVQEGDVRKEDGNHTKQTTEDIRDEDSQNVGKETKSRERVKDREKSDGGNDKKDRTEKDKIQNKGGQDKSKHDAEKDRLEKEKRRDRDKNKDRKKRSKRDPEKSSKDPDDKNVPKKSRHDISGEDNDGKRETVEDSEKDLKKKKVRASDKRKRHKDPQDVEKDGIQPLDDQDNIDGNKVKVNEKEKGGTKSKRTSDKRKHDGKMRPDEKDEKEAHQKSPNKASKSQPVDSSELNESGSKHGIRTHIKQDDSSAHSSLGVSPIRSRAVNSNLRKSILARLNTQDWKEQFQYESSDDESLIEVPKTPKRSSMSARSDLENETTPQSKKAHETKEKVKSEDIKTNKSTARKDKNHRKFKTSEKESDPPDEAGNKHKSDKKPKNDQLKQKSETTQDAEETKTPADKKEKTKPSDKSRKISEPEDQLKTEISSDQVEEKPKQEVNKKNSSKMKTEKNHDASDDLNKKSKSRATKITNNPEESVEKQNQLEVTSDKNKHDKRDKSNATTKERNGKESTRSTKSIELEETPDKKDKESAKDKLPDKANKKDSSKTTEKSDRKSKTQAKKKLKQTDDSGEISQTSSEFEQKSETPNKGDRKTENKLSAIETNTDPAHVKLEAPHDTNQNPKSTDNLEKHSKSPADAEQKPGRHDTSDRKSKSKVEKKKEKSESHDESRKESEVSTGEEYPNSKRSEKSKSPEDQDTKSPNAEVNIDLGANEKSEIPDSSQTNSKTPRPTELEKQSRLGQTSDLNRKSQSPVKIQDSTESPNRDRKSQIESQARTKSKALDELERLSTTPDAKNQNSKAPDDQKRKSKLKETQDQNESSGKAERDSSAPSEIRISKTPDESVLVNKRLNESSKEKKEPDRKNTSKEKAGDVKNSQNIKEKDSTKANAEIRSVSNIKGEEDGSKSIPSSSPKEQRGVSDDRKSKSPNMSKSPSKTPTDTSTDVKTSEIRSASNITGKKVDRKSISSSSPKEEITVSEDRKLESPNRSKRPSKTPTEKSTDVKTSEIRTASNIKGKEDGHKSISSSSPKEERAVSEDRKSKSPNKSTGPSRTPTETPIKTSEKVLQNKNVKLDNLEKGDSQMQDTTDQKRESVDASTVPKQSAHVELQSLEKPLVLSKKEKNEMTNFHSSKNVILPQETEVSLKESSILDSSKDKTTDHVQSDDEGTADTSSEGGEVVTLELLKKRADEAAMETSAGTSNPTNTVRPNPYSTKHQRVPDEHSLTSVPPRAQSGVVKRPIMSAKPSRSAVVSGKSRTSFDNQSIFEYPLTYTPVEENKDSSDLTHLRMAVSRTSANLYKKPEGMKAGMPQSAGIQNQFSDSDEEETEGIFLTMPPDDQSDEYDIGITEREILQEVKRRSSKQTPGNKNQHANDAKDRMMKANTKSNSKTKFPWKHFSKAAEYDSGTDEKSPRYLKTNQPKIDPISLNSKQPVKSILKSKSKRYDDQNSWDDVSDYDISSVDEEDVFNLFNIPKKVEQKSPFAVKPFLENTEELSDDPIFNQAALASSANMMAPTPTKSRHSNFKVKPQRFTKSSDEEAAKQRKSNKFKSNDESRRKTPNRRGILKSSKNNKQHRDKQQRVSEVPRPPGIDRRVSKIPVRQKSQQASVYGGSPDNSDEEPPTLKKSKTSVSFRKKSDAQGPRRANTWMGTSHTHPNSRRKSKERDNSTESSDDDRNVPREAREYSKQRTKSTIRIQSSRMSRSSSKSKNRHTRTTSGSSDEDSEDQTQEYTKQRTKSTIRLRSARRSPTSPKSKSRNVKSPTMADDPQLKMLMSLLDAAKEHLVLSNQINNNETSKDRNNNEPKTIDGMLLSGGEEPLDLNSLTLLKKSISSVNLKKPGKENSEAGNEVKQGKRHLAKEMSGKEFQGTDDEEGARASSTKVMGEKSVTPKGSTRQNITPGSFLQETPPESASSKLRLGSSPLFSPNMSEIEGETITMESLKNYIKSILPSLSRKDLEHVADKLVIMGVETIQDLAYIEKSDLEKTRLNPIQARKLLSTWKPNTADGRRSIAGSAVELPTETDHLPAEELIDRNRWLKFNVGGVMLETTRDTIDRFQSPFLALLLDPDSEDVEPPPDGIYRIDRNPKAFQLLLDYARYGKIVGNPDDLGEEFLLGEIEYYKMDREVLKCVTDYFDAKRNGPSAGGIQVEKISITEMTMNKQYKHHNSYGITNTTNIACYTSVPGGKGICQTDVQSLFLYETAYLRFPALFRAPCLKCGHIVCFADDPLIGTEGWCHKCHLCLRCQDILCEGLSDDGDLRGQQTVNEDLVRKTAKVVFLHDPGTPGDAYDLPSSRNGKLALIPFQGGREQEGGKGRTLNHVNFKLPKLPNAMDVPMHSVRANMYRKSNREHPMSRSFSDFGKW